MNSAYFYFDRKEENKWKNKRVEKKRSENEGKGGKWKIVKKEKRKKREKRKNRKNPLLQEILCGVVTIACYSWLPIRKFLSNQ